MEFQNITLFVYFCIVIAMLTYYAFIHRSDGVTQRVRVYGSKYHIRTKVYVKGKRIYSWVDETEIESKYHRIRRRRKKQGKTKYLEFKNKS